MVPPLLAQNQDQAQAITDPLQVPSRSKPDVQKLALDKLFMSYIVGGTAWSPDGKSIAFISNISGRRNLWLVAASGGAPVQITTSDQRQASPAWSPDGKWIAFISDHDGNEQWDIFLVHSAGGEVTNLTHTPEIADTDPAWAPDGKFLLMTSDAVNGYQNNGFMEIGSQQIDWLTTDKWEYMGGNFSPNGKLLTWTANVDGNTDITVFTIASRTPQVLPLKKGTNILGGSESAFSRDGSHLLVHHNGADSPTDIWVYDFASGQSRTVTRSLVAGVRAEDMVEPFLVHFPSNHRKWQLSAFVYVPWNLQRKPENPAIVYIHGGPSSQTVNSFDRSIQYLVNQGYIVIAPNYRAATSYGKDFQEANFMDMGGGDLQDNLAAPDWIKKTGYVDPKKLIIMGGSYGGYMTMMVITKAPTLWTAGVAIVAFVNWFTEIENEDP